MRNTSDLNMRIKSTVHISFAIIVTFLIRTFLQNLPGMQVNRKRKMLSTLLVVVDTRRALRSINRLLVTPNFCVSACTG